MATSKIQNSEYFRNGEKHIVKVAYLFGMTNGSGDAIVASVPLPKKIPTGASISVSGSLSAVYKNGGSAITGLTMDNTATIAGDNLANLILRGSAMGGNAFVNVVPSAITLTFTIS